MQVSLRRLEIAGLPNLLRRFGEWWLREFLNLFPARIVELLSGRGRTLLVVSADQDGGTFELLDSAHTLIASERTTLLDDVPEEIDRFLRSQSLERGDVDMGLRLPAENVFSRQLLLPAEAIAVIDAIVVQDLVKKTPFKPEDIYSDHGTLERMDGNKIKVWQWITRRQYVHQALLPLKIGVEDLAFIVFDKAASGTQAPFIGLRPDAFSQKSWHWKATQALCCSAMVLILIAGGLKYWNQQTAIDQLDERIAAVSGKARQVRLLVDQLQEKKAALLRLRLQRSERPGLIDLWEEMTRVLPSHSWLTEFRLVETAGKREEQIAISGFSGAAPSLVGIIDGSALFFDAALTSPIAFDAAEGRERFALQAKVRAPGAAREALR
jgi:general secretion pathway protein L